MSALNLAAIEARRANRYAEQPTTEKAFYAALDDLAALLEAVRTLRDALVKTKRAHLYVEDCWYACPKRLDSTGRSECCNDADLEAGVCTCGADRHNAAIDAALALVSGSPQP